EEFTTPGVQREPEEPLLVFSAFERSNRGKGRSYAAPVAKPSWQETLRNAAEDEFFRVPVTKKNRTRCTRDASVPEGGRGRASRSRSSVSPSRRGGESLGGGSTSRRLLVRRTPTRTQLTLSFQDNDVRHPIAVVLRDFLSMCDLFAVAQEAVSIDLSGNRNIGTGDVARLMRDIVAL
ncbi:unnamed protein product, partial [Amoebophrya sp. A25]